MTTLIWFRHDLRLADNPALAWACARGDVVPLYIDDTTDSKPYGAASRWWLHHALADVTAGLGGLVLRRGDPREVIPQLVAETGATAVCWNRDYEPHAIARDRELKELLQGMNLEVTSHKARVLFEPWEVTTQQGDWYKVFTPFWKACLAKADEIATPLPAPKLRLAPLPAGDKLDDWGLLPSNPNWADGWHDLWTPTEAGAMARLEGFIADGLLGYAKGRDVPSQPHVSRLSPFLHWGQISPRQVWQVVNQAVTHEDPRRKDADKFLAEVGWREFSINLLYHFPKLPTDNFKPAFDAYPWQDNPEHLHRWQRGQTGYPLVDAGMRELWATGYMHNRVRMVVASFLIKHLRQDWRHGESWFWDTLVDADLANNSASWQWVAGSGADASPYFRIFNPFGQGQKFDADGTYVRRWVPELALLPNEFIHTPWEAPALVLHAADVTLGDTYPMPIVDHAEARAAAMVGYQQVTQNKNN